MFTSETAKIARNSHKKESDGQKQSRTMAENQRFKQKYYDLKQKFDDYIQKTNEPHLWSKIMTYCKEKYNILHEHISNIRESTSSSGHRFDSEILRQFYILVSFYGKSLLELLHQTFCFPSWKSTKQWKKDILQKFNISFDGSEQSLDCLIKTIYTEKILEQKVVIAVDAVSVSPNITVSKDGTVTGLVDLKRIDQTEVLKIIRSPEEFASFIECY